MEKILVGMIENHLYYHRAASDPLASPSLPAAQISDNGFVLDSLSFHLLGAFQHCLRFHGVTIDGVLLQWISYGGGPQ